MLFLLLLPLQVLLLLPLNLLLLLLLAQNLLLLALLLLLGLLPQLSRRRVLPFGYRSLRLRDILLLPP